MKRLNYNNALYFALLVCVFTNCKPSKTATSSLLKTTPEAYNNTKDSTNSGKVDWKNYFTNPTLIDLIDTALANNLDLMVAAQKINMARSQVKYTKGLPLPYISGTISTAQRRYGRYTMDGAGNSSTYITPGQIVPTNLPDHYGGLQSSWEIDVWGKLRNKKRAAVAKYLASIEGKNWVITNLIADIASSYYEILALDIELDIIRETIILQNNQLAIILLQKEAGRANELAVKQFEAQVLNSKSLEIEILQKIIECENKLNFLLGRYPQTIKRDKLSFTQSVPAQVHVGIPSDLLNNRPDVKQAEYELIASKANVKAARAAFYPSLNINAAGGLQSFNTAFLISPQSFAYSLLGGLTAPLINTSAIKAQFRNAKASQLEAMYHYQKSIINGYVEVYNQMVNINNLEQIYKLKNEEVEVLTTAIETSSELYLTGRATYIEIIITRKNALLSKLELIEIKQRQYKAVVNIYKALGGGWK